MAKPLRSIDAGEIILEQDGPGITGVTAEPALPPPSMALVPAFCWSFRAGVPGSEFQAGWKVHGSRRCGGWRSDLKPPDDYQKDHRPDRGEVGLLIVLGVPSGSPPSLP